MTRNTDPASAEAQWASDRIDELVQKFTSLYELSIETVEEFNQVNGADNIKMKNSIVVNAKLNLKLYAALSVILFLFLGCFCAIFLGRLGDFVDYYLYVDKKSGLPNRERCDAMVDRYSTVRPGADPGEPGRLRGQARGAADRGPSLFPGKEAEGVPG